MKSYNRSFSNLYQRLSDDDGANDNENDDANDDNEATKGGEEVLVQRQPFKAAQTKEGFGWGAQAYSILSSSSPPSSS